MALMITDARGETQLVPMFGVTERYDSNVALISKSAATTTQREDFVTTLSPSLAMRSRGGPVDVNAVVGAVGELYRNNTSFNYIGINSSVLLGVTPLLARVLPLAKLTVTGRFQYTPVPPGFLNGNQNPQSQDPTIRGIQSFRTDTTSYGGGGMFAYPITQSVGLQTSYAYSRVHFGTQTVSANGSALLDTQSHTIGLGPTMQISRNDTLFNTYTLNIIEQPGVGNGIFRTHSDVIGWRRSWSSNFSSQASAGAQLIEENDFVTEGQQFKQPAAVAPTFSLIASYLSRTELFADASEGIGEYAGLKQLAGSLFPTGIPSAGRYSLTFSYSYAAYPLFVGTGGLSKSHTIGANGTIGLSQQLSGFYGGTFARNLATATGANLNVESYALTAGFNYLITPSLRSALIYTYSGSYGIGDQPQGATTDLLTYHRQAVLLNFVYAFSGGSQFFQTGGGSYFGSGSSGGMGTGSGIR